MKKMSKKKYIKSSKSNCCSHKAQYCVCITQGHRYWISKKYYGYVEDGQLM